jgi:hypothetical protein
VVIIEIVDIIYTDFWSPRYLGDIFKSPELAFDVKNKMESELGM